MKQQFIDYINKIQELVESNCYIDTFTIFKQSIILNGIIHIAIRNINENRDKMIPITIVLFQKVHIDIIDKKPKRYLYKFKMNDLEFRYIRFDKFYNRIVKVIQSLCQIGTLIH